jgi:hypothetical protein
VGGREGRRDGSRYGKGWTEGGKGREGKGECMYASIHQGGIRGAVSLGLLV